MSDNEIQKLLQQLSQLNKDINYLDEHGDTLLINAVKNKKYNIY